MLACSRVKGKDFNDLELLVLFDPCLESALLEGGDHSIREFLCAGFAANVTGRVFSLAVDSFKRLLYALACGPLVEAVQHHDAAHQQTCWIGISFAGNIGRGPMHRLERRKYTPIVV